MKQPLITFLVLSVLLPATAFGAEVFSGELTDDLFFPDGVKVLGVKGPEGDPDQGTSTVTIDGYGSMTIGDRTTGDFPRIALLGGTTILNHRDWTNHYSKTWWTGAITAPIPKKKIALRDIPELHPALDRGVRLEVLGTYRWGGENERFEYSIPARVAFEVEAFDNEKIFTVFEQPDGSWRVNRDVLCSAENNLCVLDVTSVSAITLIKHSYEVAADDNESGGFWADVFGGDDGSDPESFFEDLLEGDGAPAAQAPVSNTPQAAPVESAKMPYNEWYNSQIEAKNIPKDDQRHYKVQYLGTNSDASAQMYDEEGLSPEELVKVRKLNAGKLSRRLRNEPEAAPVVEDDTNSRFLDYLFAMRNKFGEGEQANVYSAQTEPLEKASTDTWKEPSMEGTMRLPSSGPGAFILIALVGFVLMVLGALRRQ